jgi:inhibitor of cysteine peptidase
MVRRCKIAHVSVVALLLVTLLLTVGCGTSSEVKLGIEDNGRQIELDQGQSLLVVLKSNPTTGFRWEIAELDEPILRQMGEVEFEQSGSKNLVGAGGWEKLRFEASSPGESTLRLIYHRPWEEDVEPLETFSVRVVVH